jgi:hypothetical protein
MKTPAYDFILPFFTANDEMRPTMSHIHSDDNGFLYATNAHIVIRVPRDCAMLKYEKVEKYPNAESVFNQYTFTDKGVIKTDNLVEILTAYKWFRTVNHDECEKCKGSGTLECEHCGSDYECKDCNGKGKFNRGTIELSLLATEEYNCVVNVANKLFKADFMHILALSAKMLDVKEIEVSLNTNDYEPHIFKVGDADILIMPKQKGLDDFVRKITVKQI